MGIRWWFEIRKKKDKMKLCSFSYWRLWKTEIWFEKIEKKINKGKEKKGKIREGRGKKGG